MMQRGSKINDDFDEYDFDFEMESRNVSQNPSLIGMPTVLEEASE